DVARDKNDPQWCSTVIGPGGAVQDSDGRLLFPAWKYVWGNFCVFSEDHGKTWCRGELVPGGKTGDENQLVVLGDGSLLMDYRQNGKGVPHRWCSISRDGGRSWSEPWAGEVVSPVACAIERLDEKRIVWTGPTDPKRARLVIRTSVDDARSFDEIHEKVIYDGPAAYSDLQRLRDGAIGVLWEKDNYREIVYTRLPVEWFAQPEGCRCVEDGENLVITADGKLFATYLKRSHTKPVLFPVYGPTGRPMTRFRPMDESIPGETGDHPHQRSFWFTHGEVNGVSFWHEMDGCGQIVETSRQVTETDGRVELTTTNDWIMPDHSVVLMDRRHLVFRKSEVEGSTVYGIDPEVTLTAVADEVLLGDTKEGAFGIRVWEEMRPDREKGGKIVNAEGLQNDDAWGKRSDWVDYSGSVQGENVGILVMNHPTSFRAPTWWHVRTYGLFAANPFGIGDFTGDPSNPGDLRLKKGETITLKYRVLLHDATMTPEKMAQAFEMYAKQAEN
ncbi:MAG: PmoA family protein, partial [Planctomycetia bacterium]|nr:PmoA family protein [Planctomycetia bacterium]